MSSCPQKYHSQFYLKFNIFNFLFLFLKMIIRMDVRLLEVFCNVYTCVVKCRRILSSKLFCLLILPLLFRRPFLFMTTTTTTTMISDCYTLYVYFIFRQTSLLLQLQRTSTVQAQNSCSEWKSIGKIWFWQVHCYKLIIKYNKLPVWNLFPYRFFSRYVLTDRDKTSFLWMLIMDMDKLGYLELHTGD